MSRLPMADWLRRAGAHHDLASWAEAYGDDWNRAFAECPRADWILGVAWRLGAGPRALVAASVRCARAAAPYGAENHPEGRAAMAAAEAFAAGEATDEVCAEAARQAELAAEASVDGSVAASLRSAAAAAHTCISPEAAPFAAAFAVEAAVLDAGDCAMISAMRFMQDHCAAAVREALDVDRVVALAPPT